MATLASLMAQMVKNPPAMQETWVQSMGWDDPLEKGMAIHCSILFFFYFSWRSQIENLRSCTITPMAAAHQAPAWLVLLDTGQLCTVDSSEARTDRIPCYQLLH